MKKANLTILSILIIFICSIQQINASPFNEKEKEIKNSKKSVNSPGYVDVTYEEISHSDIFVLNTTYFQSIIKVEKEVEMSLEKWMLETDDKLWGIDDEEPLKLESWMLDSSDWLCNSLAL